MPDLLVNSAGITGFKGPFDGPPPAHDPENMTFHNWRAIQAVNLDCTFLGYRPAIRAMRSKVMG